MGKRRGHPASERKKWLRTRELRVNASRLEIASGYDGLLAGAPEPVILVAGYAVGVGATQTLFRSLHVADLTSARFPQIALTAETFGPATCLVPENAMPLIVVCGVEDDGGGGVSAVLGALERADAIGITVDTTLHVHALHELRELLPEWRGGMRTVEVFVDGRPLSDLAAHDDWIGSAATIVNTPSDEQRAHLVTGDRVNDWTAVVSWKLHH